MPQVNSPFRDSAIYAAVVCFALGLGCFLHWPSLDAGLRSDDYPQRAMLRGEFAVERDPLDLFSFASGAPRDVYRLMDFGYLPWWSVPDLRLRMWRPVASALIVLDQSVLDLSPELQHVHSLLWYCLLVIAASRVYRRWLSLPAAAVATVCFAIEEGHTVPVGWLANRSTLTATAFGLLALELHASTREAAPGDRVLARQLATAACAALALLAGEYAFTALAFVFAYECLRPEPIVLRLRRSLPVLAPTLVYLVVHTWIGSDIVGSGYYISPLRDPLAFAGAAVMRVPALFADLALSLPADEFNGIGPLRNFFLTRNWFTPRIWSMFPPWPYWHAAIGYLAFGLGYLLFKTGLRRVPEASRRPLQVFALGSVLSLAPAAGSLPGDRLIVAAAFGVAGIAGALLVPWNRDSLHLWARVRRRSQSARRRKGESPFEERNAASDAEHAPRHGRNLWSRGLAYAFPRRGSIAFGASLAWLWVFTIAGPRSFERTYGQAGGYAFSAEGARIWSRAAELPVGPAAAQTRVYVLGTADFTTAVNLPWVRLAEGMPLPLSYRRLCAAVAPFDLLRTSPRSLRLTILNSNVNYTAKPSLHRSDAAPMQENQLIRLPGLDVMLVSVRDGNPAVIDFDFDRQLEDPTLWFVHSTTDGLKRVDMPKVGETMRILRPVYRDLRFPVNPL